MATGATSSQQRTDADVDGLLRGAFDLNCWCTPSTFGYTDDHIVAAETAASLGMGGLIFRDHGYCTASIASFLSATRFRATPIRLNGSVILNTISGGFNVYAAEHTLMLGGRMVSMPTHSAQNYLRAVRWPSRAEGAETQAAAMTAVAARGTVADVVLEILDVIAQRDGVLHAGYLHVSEVVPLFREAARRGVKRLLLSDPVRRNIASTADISELFDLGAAMEFLPQADEVSGPLLRQVLQQRPDRLVLGLDIGPLQEPLDHASRYRRALRCWLQAGLDPVTIRAGIADNIASLIGHTPAARSLSAAE